MDNFKEQIQTLFKNILPAGTWQKILALEDWAHQLYAPRNRPQIHRGFLWVLCLVSCYSLGKIAALALQVAPPGSDALPRGYNFTATSIQEQTRAISTQDLFNTGSKVQRPAKIEQVTNEPCLSANTPSSSGATLITTITLQNRLKSLAIVKLRNKPDPLGLRQGDNIPAVGRIDRIEPSKILLRNQSTNQCEFIASKTQAKDTMRNSISVLPKKEGQKLLAQREGRRDVQNDGNRFTIKRSYLNEGLDNLASLLEQVQATQIKNPDGTLLFKVAGIPPESLFAKLGIENEDQIKYIDGKPIRSQAQIFSLLNSFNSVSELSITVLRNGGEQKLEYTLTD